MNTINCELCSAESPLSAYTVPGAPQEFLNSTALICDTCHQQIQNPTSLNANHWRSLHESIWTDNPAVKVIAWRILNKLSSENWSQDLLLQLDLDDDLLTWARAELSQEISSAASNEARDSNGSILKQGDSVTLIKDLDVKGAGFTAKRGTLVKNISVTADPGLIEGKVNGTQIVLKTCFLKKVI